MIKKTWKEFQDCKMLWWVNRSLHLFGWAIVLEHQEDGTITDCYPARVSWRGFPEAVEEAGFVGLTQHLATNARTLVRDAAPPENPTEDSHECENFWPD